MTANLQYTSSQLKRALHLKEQIEKLESKLSSILGGSEPKQKGTNRMSTAGRAAIQAAQLKRWAKAKGKKGGRRKMSAAGRARIAAAAKKRWAAAKAAGKTRL